MSQRPFRNRFAGVAARHFLPLGRRHKKKTVEQPKIKKVKKKQKKNKQTNKQMTRSKRGSETGMMDVR